MKNGEYNLIVSLLYTHKKNKIIFEFVGFKQKEENSDNVKQFLTYFKNRFGEIANVFRHQDPLAEKTKSIVDNNANLF